MSAMKCSVLMAIVALTACASGVPSVDDPVHPEVDGEAMSTLQFLQKYCIGDSSDETCTSVRNAAASALQMPNPSGLPESQ